MSLPSWTKFTVIDRWGRKWAYSKEPKIIEIQGRRIWSVDEGKIMMIRLGSIPKDWTQTLEVVK